MGQTVAAAIQEEVVEKQRKPVRKKRSRPIEEAPEEDFGEFSNSDVVPDIVDFKCSSSSEGFNRRIKMEDLIQIEEGEQLEEAPKKRKRGRPKKRK